MANGTENCVFCCIKENLDTFVYENEEYLAFKDKSPAASHHYLVIPKNHVKNPSTLRSSDVSLVKTLVEIGKEILMNENVSIDDARMGFHWPPFNTVQHLHLHVIASVNEMGFFSKLIFKPDSYWFITASTFIERLEKGN
ncbi:Histidine triad nucleotide-binding protein 3, partial [Stegodyphus mimosarum]